jgi:hypothetical protein
MYRMEQMLAIFIEKKKVTADDLKDIPNAFNLMSEFISTLVYNKKYLQCPKHAVEQGIKVEYEHIAQDTPFAVLIATMIACDHLKESPKYYDLLEEMEKKF